MIDVTDRLDGVRQTGRDRWLARCPAHDDRSPSLSLRRTETAWLIHCFAGCETADVVAAIGLELVDLFADHHDHHAPGRAPRVSASDALRAIDHEAAVVAIIAADVLAHRRVDDATWARLGVAVQRIGRARQVCAG